MDRVKQFGKNTFVSLQVRNYRLFFIGQIISVSGSWMQSVAQSWLVLTLTNSGMALGVVAAAQFLPILLFGSWAGLWVDRFSKRKLLFLVNLCSAILAAALGFLVWTQTVSLWEVYVLATLTGFLNAFENPARQSFVSELVGKEYLANAVSLNSAQFNLARVVGPAVAGGIIATVGMAPCFFFNAVSFAAVLVGLAMMRERELFPLKLAKLAKGQVMEGLRYVKSKPALKDTLIIMAVIGTLSYEFQVVLPLLAQFSFSGGAQAYAFLTSAMGLGSVIGAVYTANRKKNSHKLIPRASLLFGVSLLVAAISPNLNMAILAMVVVGLFSINLTSLGNVTLQLESPPHMRGRVMALWAVVFLGSTPIGGPIIGFLSQHWGPRWGLGLGGLAAVLAAAWGYGQLKKSGHKIFIGGILIKN